MREKAEKIEMESSGLNEYFDALVGGAGVCQKCISRFLDEMSLDFLN